MFSLGSKILMLMTARTYGSRIQDKHFRPDSPTLRPTVTSHIIRACGFPRRTRYYSGSGRFWNKCHIWTYTSTRSCFNPISTRHIVKNLTS
ncbi:hypothetical protein GLOIN_2v1713683, partial [Rhizophagus irregularis DAOM 181602=DAOM 197198]